MALPHSDYPISTNETSFSIEDKFYKILDKYLMGIIVARSGGDILYSKSFNEEIHLPLMSNFIAALSMFGEENVGKIRRILVEGLNIEMNIVAKHDLILTMIFRPNMVKVHINEFYERGLDLFYNRFKESILANKTNQSIYQQIESEMYDLLYEYILSIDAL